MNIYVGISYQKRVGVKEMFINLFADVINKYSRND